MFSLKSPTTSFVTTVKGVLLSPVNFFKTTSWEKVPLTDSVVFAFICYAVAQVITFLLSSLQLFNTLPQSIRGMTSAGQGINYFLVAFIMAIVMFFINAGVVYLVIKYVFKSKSSFNATVAALSAVAAVSLLAWIPVVNILVGLYGLILTVIAVREMAKLTTVQAVITLVISFIVNAILTGVLFAQIMASFYLNQFQSPGVTDLKQQIPNYTK